MNKEICAAEVKVGDLIQLTDEELSCEPISLLVVGREVWGIGILLTFDRPNFNQFIYVESINEKEHFALLSAVAGM